MENPSIQENILLKDLTTFHLGGLARYFVAVTNINDLKKAILWAKEKEVPVFVLGGGSNLVISDAGFSGLVIQIKIIGLEILHEDDEKILFKVGAGEVWDGVVEHTVERGWWGLENMSLIYGTVGGIIVQNAGAYGTEVCSNINRVIVYDQELGEIKEFFKEECNFGYRSSLFQKTKRYVIISAIFEFKRTGLPNINYPDVAKYFAEKNISQPSLMDVRSAIVFIRQNKLPDPEILGSAGSFFRNLLLTPKEYQNLKEKITANFKAEIVAKLEEIKNKFPIAESIKIPTAWILDICGLKGQRVGQAVIYEKQPLILTNENNCTTTGDLMSLVKKIRQTVFIKTGIKLELEPELVGFSEQERTEYSQL